MPRAAGRERPTACTRCRKQKLKCDKEKPCTLCYHAGVPCVPREDARVSKNKLTSQSDSANGTPTTDRATALWPDATGSLNSVQIDSNQRQQPSGPGQDAKPTRAGSADRLALTSSAMRFAQKLFKDDMAEVTASASTTDNDLLHVLVGDPCISAAVPWRLKLIERPKLAVVDSLLDVYLAHAHWHVLMFIFPLLKERMRVLWRRPTWQRTEAGEVLAILATVLVGATLASDDSSWPGHILMEEHRIKLATLQEDLLREIKEHLLDIMGDCSLESVQICLLLSRYYALIGDTGSGWTVVGMASRNAYAAGFHLNHPRDGNPVQSEIRRRVWLAVKTIDTFSAMFQGRPPSLDSNFLYRCEPYYVDDLRLHPDLASHHLLNRDGIVVNLGTFHGLKYELYSIMDKTLSAFRHIREGVDSPENQRLLCTTVRDSHQNLMKWYNYAPPFFDQSTWQSNDPLGTAAGSQQAWATDARTLTLQSLSLQTLFNSLVILLHRPIIELGLKKRDPTPLGLNNEDVSWSVQAAVDAALRIARLPLGAVGSESSLSMMLMNALMASVILCIPPLYEPGSARAHQAKEAISHIATGCKQLCVKAPVAEYISTLVSSLMATVERRESASLTTTSSPSSTSTSSPGMLQLPLPPLAATLRASNSWYNNGTLSNLSPHHHAGFGRGAYSETTLLPPITSVAGGVVPGTSPQQTHVNGNMSAAQQQPRSGPPLLAGSDSKATADQPWAMLDTFGFAPMDDAHQFAYPP